MSFWGKALLSSVVEKTAHGHTKLCCEGAHRHRFDGTCMQMQRLVIAEVREAAAPLGDVSGAVAEDLALHLQGRQAGLHRLLLPLNKHHRIPAGAVRGSLTSVVNAQLAYTLQTWRGGG